MDSGCYQLKIKVGKNISIKVGALGICRFKKGTYIYTGSALKNLSKRVARHQKSEKKLHWHIDYLLAAENAELVEVARHFSENKEECVYNQLLIRDGAETAIAGFGSSDCRKCPSHLLKIA